MSVRFWVFRVLKVCCTLYLVGVTSVWAQEQANIDIVGEGFGNKQMYFLAEMHTGQERAAFTNAMLHYLVAQHGITNIVLETSASEAYLQNQYLHDGDTTLFRYYPNAGMRKTLDGLRQLNANLPAGKQITVYGMDFERAEFVVAAKMILEMHGGRGSALHKYLCSVPDSFVYATHMTIEQRKLRQDVWRDAQKVYQNQIKLLEHLLGKHYPELQRIFENPTSEWKFSRRDKGMYRNIHKQLGSAPFVCVVGSYHTWYHRGQVYPSLVKLLVKAKKDNRKKMVIIDEVFNGTMEANMLFSHDSDSLRYEYQSIGPGYFVRNDSAMARAYARYHTPGSFQVVNRKEFADIVPQSNHGLDSYFVFFGEAPQPVKK